MTWIQTHTGKHFDLLDPKPELVDPRDIVYALANICRFTGHVRPFYSVAQHCVHVAKLVSPAARAWGLLHDAAEAYVGDINQPLHVAMRMTIKPIERKIAEAIRQRFGIELTPDIETEVHEADLTMLATEARDLLPGGPIERWTDALKPLPTKVPAYLTCGGARIQYAYLGIDLGLWTYNEIEGVIE